MSYLSQDIDLSKIEIIIVDGMSNDNTLANAKEILSESLVNYKILENPQRTLAAGWNIAIKAASGEFVCRIDSHSYIPNNYISSLLSKYNKLDSNCVGIGGVLQNSFDSEFGCIATSFYSSKFGVGNSPFRIMSKGILETDTAVFALYRRSLFDKIGYFNEKLGRNQDIEFHKRVIKNNYKLYTDYSVVINYYVRSDYISFLKKAFNDGYWVVRSDSYYLRHLIPLLFFVYLSSSLLVSVFFDFNLPLYSLVLYFILCIYFSVLDGKSILSKLLLPVLYFTYHFSYGLGSFIALIKKFYINKY